MTNNFFTQTSDLLYDNHAYQVIHNNNKKVVFNNYYDMQQYWYENSNFLSCVNILNKKVRGGDLNNE